MRLIIDFFSKKFTQYELHFLEYNRVSFWFYFLIGWIFVFSDLVERFLWHLFVHRYKTVTELFIILNIWTLFSQFFEFFMKVEALCLLYEHLAEYNTNYKKRVNRINIGGQKCCKFNAKKNFSFIQRVFSQQKNVFNKINQFRWLCQIIIARIVVYCLFSA